MNYTDPRELLPVVDARDRVVGTMTRREIHEKGLLHRAAHVLLFDPQGRLYLQKRSAAKDTYPGKWTSSASGHVDPGESYAQCAARELGEELGIEARLDYLGRLPAGPRTENEFVEVFTAVSPEAPRPNPQEIETGRFFTPAEALALAADPARACPSLGAVLELWREVQGG